MRDRSPERIEYKKQWCLENKDRLREMGKKWYKKNKKSVIERTQKRRKEIVEWLDNYKSKQKCSNCPENHPATLDFHHIDPKQKDIGINSIRCYGWGIEKIEKEIQKCVVLCSNCHRKLHWSKRYEPI